MYLGLLLLYRLGLHRNVISVVLLSLSLMTQYDGIVVWFALVCAGSSGLPANPFIAKVKGGKCECVAPQDCSA